MATLEKEELTWWLEGEQTAGRSPRVNLARFVVRNVSERLLSVLRACPADLPAPWTTNIGYVKAMLHRDAEDKPMLVGLVQLTKQKSLLATKKLFNLWGVEEISLTRTLYSSVVQELRCLFNLRTKTRLAWGKPRSKGVLRLKPYKWPETVLRAMIAAGHRPAVAPFMEDFFK